MPTLGESIEAKGWSTGCVLSPESLPAFAEYMQGPGRQAPELAEADWLVVISQTCDVVAHKQDAEPYVEILHCKPIAKTRSQFRDLRSTRRLDFLPNRNTHEGLALSAHATADRYCVPRELLATHQPHPGRALDAIAVRRVLAWYALRASRPAWPDALVSRIEPVAEKLESTIEPLRDDIAEIRVAINPGGTELPGGEPYRLAVFFVVDEGIWTSEPDTVTCVNEAFNAFIGLLLECEGIEVDDDSAPVNGGEFTWQETRSTDEWNFANVSHRG